MTSINHPTGGFLQRHPWVHLSSFPTRTSKQSEIQTGDGWTIRHFTGQDEKQQTISKKYKTQKQRKQHIPNQFRTHTGDGFPCSADLESDLVLREDVATSSGVGSYLHAGLWGLARTARMEEPTRPQLGASQLAAIRESCP